MSNTILEKDWREIFGRTNERMKEQELILRFFALYFDLENYQKPLKGFLNYFMSSNRNLQRYSASDLNGIILPAITLVNQLLGKKAFRLGRGVNAALFDSILIGICKRTEKKRIKNKQEFLEAYNDLIANKDFILLAKDGTSDELTVKKRIEIAISQFENLT